MEYGRFEPTDSARFSENIPRNQTQTRKNILIDYVRVIILVVLAIVALLAIIVFVIVNSMHYKNKPSSPSSSSSSSSPSLSSPPSQVASLGDLTRMCQVTRYPDLCVESLGERYIKTTQAMQENGYDDSVDGIGYGNKNKQGRIVEVSQYVTLDKVQNGLNYLNMEKEGFDQIKDSNQWSVHDDCIELMEDSVDLLTRSHSLFMMLLSSSSYKTINGTLDDDDQGNNQRQSDMMDFMTWTTTICTNQDTCTEGFEEVDGTKDPTAQIIQELSQIVSNHLILSSSVMKNDAVYGRMLLGRKPNMMDHKILDGPNWLSRKNMELLGTSLDNMRPNITVSQDDNGPSNVTVRTITEAIKKAPKNSSVPFIIHVKAGRYHEDILKVARSKTNLWFIGDGKGITIITGSKSVRANRVTTSKTPTFGANGDGFMARGITFENTAGAENNQAVALYVKSDRSVFYECEIKGYQDTLYVHSNRQFYRDCDIYGTVDSIFGNAQAVLQNCTIYSNKPKVEQKNTITAQKRSQTCPDSCSGISIHLSRILATPDLEPVKANYPTFLGRPWRELSTVVYMGSYIGDHVDPKGWLPWNSTSLLGKVYYGEHQNNGPGANTSQREQSPGIHVNMSVAEAARFTVGQFIGDTWIAQRRVPYIAGFR